MSCFVSVWTLFAVEKNFDSSFLNLNIFSGNKVNLVGTLGDKKYKILSNFQESRETEKKLYLYSFDTNEKNENTIKLSVMESPPIMPQIICM